MDDKFYRMQMQRPERWFWAKSTDCSEENPGWIPELILESSQRPVTPSPLDTLFQGLLTFTCMCDIWVYMNTCTHV